MNLLNNSSIFFILLRCWGRGTNDTLHACMFWGYIVPLYLPFRPYWKRAGAYRREIVTEERQKFPTVKSPIWLTVFFWFESVELVKISQSLKCFHVSTDGYWWSKASWQTSVCVFEVLPRYTPLKQLYHILWKTFFNGEKGQPRRIALYSFQNTILQKWTLSWSRIVRNYDFQKLQHTDFCCCLVR